MKKTETGGEGMKRERQRRLERETGGTGRQRGQAGVEKVRAGVSFLT